MLLLKYIFTILHIITAAAWFGLALRLTGQARAALAQGGAAGIALATDGARTVRLMSLFIVLTVAFAYATFGIGTTLLQYGVNYHIALSLILVLVAVQFALIRPGWKRLENALGGSGDGEAARKRVAMGVGIGHLLWLVLLLLMFWDRLVAAL